MIVRSKELKNFIDNITKFNGFLIYGPDKGKVKENANNIIKKLTMLALLFSYGL